MTLRNIDALFHGRDVAVLGSPEADAQRQLVANIEACLPAERLRHDLPKAGTGDDDGLDLAVILSDAWAQPRTVDALGAAGCRALLWAAAERVPTRALQAARPRSSRPRGS